MIVVNSKPKTAAEVLAAHNRKVAAVKLVAKKYPDAVLVGDQWRTDTIKSDTAKELDITLDGASARIRLAVILTAKGVEPVKVYSNTEYRLTLQHIAEFLRTNSRTLLVQLESVLKCQDDIKSSKAA